MSEDQKRKIGFEVVAENQTGQAFSEIKQDAAQMASSVAQAGEKAARGVKSIGDGADEAAAKMQKGANRLASEMRRVQEAALVAEQAGGSLAKAFEIKADFRGLDTGVLKTAMADLRQYESQVSVAKAMASEMSQVAAFTKTHEDAKKLVKDAEYVRFWASEMDKAEAVARQAASGNSFLQSLRSQSDAIGKTRADLLEMQAAQMGLTAQAAPMIAKLREAEQGVGKVGMSAAAMSAALRNVPAQFTDIVVSLQAGQAPLTVLLQQGGQLKDMFGGAGAAAKALGGYVLGLVNPFTVTAAAAATLGLAYYQGHQEQIAFVKALTLSGNAAGVTTTQLTEYARQIDAVVGTQAQATAALVAFTQAGVTGADQLRKYAQTAIEWEKASSQAIGETAKQFADLQKDPLSAVVKLNEGLNFLTADVYEQIKALKDQGRSAEASAVAMDALDGAMRDRSKTIRESLGYLERAWNAIKGAAADAWDAMLNVGRPNTINDRLGAVRKELNSLIDQQGWGETGGGAATGRVTAETKRRVQERIEALRAEEWQLESNAAAEQMNAAAQEASAKATQASIKWQGTLDQHLSKSERLTRALAAAREDYNNKLAFIPQDDLKKRAELAKELAKVEASLQDQFKDKGSSSKAGGVSMTDTRLAGLEAQLEAARQYGKQLQELGLAAKDLNAGEKESLKISSEMEKATDAKTIAKLKHAKAIADEIGAQLRSNDGAEEAMKAKDALIKGMYKSADATAEEAARIEASLGVYGKARTEIERLTLAKLKQQQADMGLIANPEYMAALSKQIKDQEALVSGMEKLDFKKFSDTLSKSLDAAKEELAIQKDGLSLLGMDELARKKIIAVRKIELDYAKKIAEVDKSKFSDDDADNERKKAELRQAIREKAEVDTQIAIGKIQEEYALANAEKYNDVFRQGFADFVNNGADGLKAFGKSLKTTILTSVADGLYKAFAQRYVVNVVASITGLFGGGGVGNAAMQAASGGGGILNMASNGLSGMNSLGMLGSLGGFMSGFGNAALASLQTLVGMTGTTAQMTASLVAAGHTAAPGMAAGTQLFNAIPGWGWALAGIGALFGGDIFSKLFGRKLRENGVEGTFGGESGFEGNMYKYYKGGWFRSNKTTRQEMPEEMRQGFADQFLGMDKSIREMAGAVGLGGEALDGFTAKIKVNLKGLSEEEAAKKLQEEFQKIADQMGGLVLTSTEYTKAGETQLEALTRLSLSITAVNGVFDSLGATILDASLASADWASSLIEVMGGLDKFGQAASTYFDLYYSDAEKQALMVRQANKGMTDQGLDLRVDDTDAKRKYRELVDNAIASKDEEMIAFLMQFADKFAAGVDAVNKATEDATAAIAEQMQKHAEELQRARDETLSSLGLSMNGLVDGFLKEVNEGRGATAGAWLADEIAYGFEEAVYAQALNTIMSSIIDGLVTPMISAALTGSSIAESVSAAAIDNMIDNANAALAALNSLLSSIEFQEGMEKIKVTIGGLGNSIGASIRPMRSYTSTVRDTSSAYRDAANAAKQAAEEAKRAFQETWNLASKNLDAAVGREKEYWQDFTDTAQESLDKAASYFDLVTDAAKGLRDSLDDVSTMQAAAGMVFIETALAQARNGLGLGDFDKTQSAIEAATGAMVMDNYRTQAELDYDKKRLAGQLDELGKYAEKQKTEAEQMVEQGNANIERLDSILDYWKSYGDASIDATLSVADAVHSLEKLAASAMGVQYFERSYEGKGSMASFAVGTNYVPSDMTARIHKGERIIPAADNRALMAALQGSGGGDNAAVVAELQALRTEVAALREQSAKGNEYARKTADNISQVTDNGNGMRAIVMNKALAVRTS